MSFAFTIARRACAAPRVLGSVSTIRYFGATAGDEKGAKKKKKMTKKELLLEANEKRVYLLDGTAMLYRAHFAGQALLNSAQEKPPVLANLTSHFSKFVHNINPKYVAVVFDHGKRTFRNELFPGYKKQRTETPPEVADAFSGAKGVFKDLGAACYSVEGFEADDVMASIGKWVGQQGMDVVYVSEDKDLLQLVGDNAFVMKSAKRVLLDAAAVAEKLSVPPQFLADFQALTGDASDNIPGIAGIGPQKAAYLVRQFETVENMYECAEACATATSDGFDVDQTHPKFEEMVACARRFAVIGRGISKDATSKHAARAVTLIKLLMAGGKENALLYKKLTQLRTDVEVPGLSLGILTLGGNK